MRHPDDDSARLRRRARRKIAAAVLIALGAGAYILAAFADRWISSLVFGTHNRADLVYYVIVGLGFVLILVAGALLLTTARLDADPPGSDRRR